jgi:hypothetical protein
VGVLSTFRIAGPIYRFEQYLRQVVKGEAEGPCRIRDGDELWDLCDLINQATAPLRMRHGEDEPEEATAAGEEPERVQPDLAELRLDETPPALSRRRAS